MPPLWSQTDNSLVGAAVKGPAGVSPCAEPCLKHELDVREHIANTSVSGTKGNSYLKGERDCQRHLLLKNIAGTA